MGVIIRQSFKGSIVNYIGLIIGYVNLVILFPAFFSEEQLGVFRLIQEMAVMFSSMALIGVNNGMIKFYPSIPKQEKDKGFMFMSLMTASFGFGLTLVILMLFKTQIFGFFSTNAQEVIRYFYLFIGVFLICVYWAIFETYTSIKRRITFPKTIREFIFRLLISLLVIAFGYKILTFDQLMNGLVAVYFVCLVLSVGYAYFLTPFSFRPHFKHISKTLKGEFVKYLGVMTLASLSTSILPRLDFLMLSSMSGLKSTGIYSMAFSIILIIEIPKRALSQITIPILSEKMNAGDHGEVNALYKKSSINQLIVGGFIFLMLWINIDLIFKIMPNGHLYSGGAVVILLLGLSKLFELSYGVANYIVFYSKYYFMSVVTSILSTIIGVVLNLWLIPLYGIVGAAIATTAAYGLLTIYFVVMVYWIERVWPFNTDTLKWLGVMLLAAGLILILPNNPNSFIYPVLKSLLILGLTGFLIYMLNISPEANNTLNHLINRLKKLGK